MSRPSRPSQLLASFIAVYPTITLLGWILHPLTGDLPWPVRTLALTAVMVPLVVFVAGPLAHGLVGRLRANGASAGPRPQPLDRAR